MLGVGIRIERLELIGRGLIEMGHNEDSGPVQDGFGSNNLEILRFSVREKVNWHAGDGQVKPISVALLVD